MNKSLLSVAGCLALIGFTFAGETTTKKIPSLTQDVKVEESSKNMEFRVGPAFNYADASIKAGRRAQGFNLSDIGFDDVSYGVKANFDWEFAKNLHWNTGFNWLNFNQSGNLDKDITWGSGNTLLKGSHLTSDIQIYQLDTKIGYDVYKNQTVRFMPYIGLNGVYADGKVAATSGSQRREQGVVSVIDQKKSYDVSQAYGNYVVGFETEFRIIKPLYLGFDFGGYHMGDFFGGVAKGYVGYDINETWTIRTGLDSQYVNFDRGVVKADGFSNTAYAQLGVKF
ncbi:MAG: hypothetical protein V4507_01675 [Verrucomicrobiota bacterium]